jgi:nitroreductase
MDTVEIAMQKSTSVEFQINKLIEQRSSKRAYADKMIEPEKVRSLFEAARWAPSANNEQPWVYVYATKDQPELWGKLFDTLNEGNRSWAGRAPLLVLSLVRKNFIRNDKPNASAKYDLGAANAFLSLEATHLNLNVHQMGGFDREKAKVNLNIPDTHEPAVMLAIGYPGEAALLPDPLKAREMAARERFTQEVFVMNKGF